MLKASIHPYELDFKFEAGTSRGVLKKKATWFLRIWNDKDPSVVGIGEVGPLQGLSPDAEETALIKKLSEVCEHIDRVATELNDFPKVRKFFGLMDYPSIVFGLESALLDLHHGGQRKLFQTEFVEGKKNLPINGLIWMGDPLFMQEQIEWKLKEGYNCIKMKIGAVAIEEELKLLAALRNRFSAAQLTLRVDANGAFTTKEVAPILQQLADLEIHSIEQPIKAGQWEYMQQLIAESPLPIGLDEELIGCYVNDRKEELMQVLKPHFLILKPTLHGGFVSCKEWIALAEKYQAGWWITSMLESNIGLNAIAQFTSTLGAELPQGLGTGQLYTNNITSPLTIANGFLKYDKMGKWGM